MLRPAGGRGTLVFLVTPKVCSLDRKGKHDDDSGNRTETKDGLLIKRGKTKNTPFVKKKAPHWPEALTSPHTGVGRGHCHSPPGGRHVPISFFPSAAFRQVDEMRCRASTSTKQLYLNHGKPSCFPLCASPPTCPAQGPRPAHT